MREEVRAALATVGRGENLDAAVSAQVFRALMAGEMSEETITELLAALARKGPSVHEIEGAAVAMREALVEVPTARAPIDTCGTGGSGIPRRNVSTAAALAVAALGVPVAKHGNRAASSKSGSADVLEALGVALSPSAAHVGRCIDEVGVGFLFARSLHPAMAHAAPARRALKIPTIFNLLGPM
ncbi:MAG: anthranilate phosphoribosyltransferase, partial [Nannocystaceae bacterium]